MLFGPSLNSEGDDGLWDGLEAEVNEGVLLMLVVEPWGLFNQLGWGTVNEAGLAEVPGAAAGLEEVGGVVVAEERWLRSIGYELNLRGRACSLPAASFKNKPSLEMTMDDDEVIELVLSVSDDPSVLSSVMSTLGVSAGRAASLLGVTVAHESTLDEAEISTLPLAPWIAPVVGVLFSIYESKYPPPRVWFLGRVVEALPLLLGVARCASRGSMKNLGLEGAE
jgi:hypothetical protein